MVLKDKFIAYARFIFSLLVACNKFMIVLYPTVVGKSIYFPTFVGFCVFAQKKGEIFMYIAQDTAIRIKMIAKRKGVSVGQMLSECELSKNALSSMQSRGSWLLANNLAKIADYLDCSVDYLLGRTDVPEVNHRSGSIMPTAEHGTIAAFGGGVHMAPDDDEPITTLPKSR